MATIRDATLELFRAHGMTTIFGNPGSTEPPMLRELPDDFTYVLGLQEQAVVGMADGFAHATGRPRAGIATTDGPRLVQARIAWGMWAEWARSGRDAVALVDFRGLLIVFG